MRHLRSLLCGVLLMTIVFSGAVPAFAAVGDYEGKWGSWGSDQPGLFDGPRGAAVARNGDVYVTEFHGQRVQYFGPSGTYKGSWGTYGSGSGQFFGASGIAVAPNGDIYVSDRGNHRIQYFSSTGAYKGQWGQEGLGIGWFKNPEGIAVARNGDVYVVDSGNHRIQYFSPTGIPRGSWGWHGTGAGLFSYPSGVGVAPTGDIYVCDGGNHRIQFFGPTGDYRGQWGVHGSGNGQFTFPIELAFAANGDVYVSDQLNHRIQYFGPTGVYKGKWGAAGSGNGEFSYPRGLAVGARDRVYVVDSSNNRVQYFRGISLPPAIQVAGTDRYATAVEASKLAFPAGAETVVIATGDNWPDALGGTALAGVVHGPILLVGRDAVPSAVMNEVVRLKAKSAIILGGPNAVGSGVASALEKRLGKGSVSRIEGKDRYETADKIARAVVEAQGAAYDGRAFVATGGDFPDALAAAPLSASRCWPLFLANPQTGLSSGTRAAMADVKEAIILGGTAVVPKETEDTIKKMPGKTTRRLAGPDRYATAVAVANYAVDHRYHIWNRAGITTGTDFPDALAGGVLQGKMGSVMLLTQPATLNPRTAAALSANRAEITTVTFFGGTKAVSASVRTHANGLVK